MCVPGDVVLALGCGGHHAGADGQIHLHRYGHQGEDSLLNRDGIAVDRRLFILPQIAHHRIHRGLQFRPGGFGVVFLGESSNLFEGRVHRGVVGIIPNYIIRSHCGVFKCNARRVGGNKLATTIKEIVDSGYHARHVPGDENIRIVHPGDVSVLRPVSRRGRNLVQRRENIRRSLRPFIRLIPRISNRLCPLALRHAEGQTRPPVVLAVFGVSIQENVLVRFAVVRPFLRMVTTLFNRRQIRRCRRLYRRIIALGVSAEYLIDFSVHLEVFARRICALELPVLRKGRVHTERNPRENRNGRRLPIAPFLLIIVIVAAAGNDHPRRVHPVAEIVTRPAVCKSDIPALIILILDGIADCGPCRVEHLI